MKKVGTEISNRFSLLSEESNKIPSTPSPTEQDIILTGYDPKGLKLHHLATSKDKLPATTKPKLSQIGKSASEGDVTTSSDWVGVETPKAQEQKRRGSSAGEREVEPRTQAGLETAGRPLTEEDEEEPVEYTLANSPPVDYNLIHTKDKTRFKKEKLNQKGVTILGTKRIFDRRSATGRSLEIKKAGAGGGNWGKVIEPDLVEIVEAERNPIEEEDESERFGTGETEKRPDQLEYLESAAREENREELSYDEYMKQLEERKPKIAPPKPREPLHEGEQGEVAKTPIHKSVTAEKAEQETEKKQGERRERKRSTPKKETIFLLSAPSALPQQQHELQEFQLRQQKEQEEPQEQQPSENQQSEQQQQTDQEMKDIRQRLQKLGMQEPESQLQQQTPPAQQQQQPEQQKFSDEQSDKQQQQTEQQQKTEEEMQDIRQQLQKLAMQEPGSQQGLSQEPRQQGLSQQGQEPGSQQGMSQEPRQQLSQQGQEQKDIFPEQKGESFAQRHSVPGGEQMGLTREQMGGGQRREEKWDQKQEAVPLEQVGVTQQSSTPQQREITQAQQPEGRRESGVEFNRGLQNPQPTESQKKETFTSFLPSSPFNDETTQL